jgi:hypothetical protein
MKTMTETLAHSIPSLSGTSRLSASKVFETKTKKALYREEPFSPSLSDADTKQILR